MKDKIKNLWSKYKPILTPAVEVTALIGLGFALGHKAGYDDGYDEGQGEILKELIRKNETLKF